MSGVHHPAIDQYLAENDCVIVSATLLRIVAKRLGWEITDERDRTAWVFKMGDAEAEL